MGYFSTLQDSGLPIDWTTIQEGRNGFGQFPTGLLTRDQLTEYAKEKLGQGSPDQQYLIFQIIDAGLQDLWTTGRCLAELAAGEITTPEIARRRWRLAVVMHFVRTPLTYLEDEYEDFKYDPELVWKRFDLPDSPPDLPYKSTFQVNQLDLDESVQILREWIRKETAFVQ